MRSIPMFLSSLNNREKGGREVRLHRFMTAFVAVCVPIILVLCLAFFIALYPLMGNWS